MRKIKTWMLLSIGLLTVLTFGACSADSEDGMSTAQMKEFSTEELQQIYQMQEDYGVSFDFPKKSDKQLPSMEELETICQIAASLQSSTKYTKIVGNSLTNCSSNKTRTRGFSKGMEYSGSRTGSHDIGSAAILYYTLTWSNVDKDHIGDFQYRIDDIVYRDSSYSVSFIDFDYEFTGAYHIDYTFTFSIRHWNEKYTVEVKNSINLEGYRNQ